MSYTILYEKPALKFIQKQPKEQQRRINSSGVSWKQFMPCPIPATSSS